VRGYITADARNQTEYGTVRSYFAVGYSQSNLLGATPAGLATDSAPVAPGFSSNRAFIQFAGFTFGLTQSFYDFFPTPALSYFGGAVNPSSDTGDGGKTAIAYTAQFGGGLSASISAEAPRSLPIYNSSPTGAPFALNPAGFTTFGTNLNSLVATSQKGLNYPDIVANLRIEQTWGAAQIMGAIHDASAQYYGATTATGNPADAMGWAVGAGLKLNSPLGPNDYFDVQANYSQGASGYPNAVGGGYIFYNGGQGGSVGLGVVTDGVYGGTTAGATNTSVDLTTAWGVNAAYEHFWSKAWQTSLYGGYVAYSYNNEANSMLCVAEGVPGGVGNAAAAGLAAWNAAGATCNNNFAIITLGSRTQWNIDSQTYLGVDIAYLGLKSAQFTLPGTNLVPIAGLGAQPTTVRSTSDQHTFLGQFRIHRNFYP
jgi:hypothetical protein